MRMAPTRLVSVCRRFPVRFRSVVMAAVSDTSCLRSSNARSTRLVGFLRRRPESCDTRTSKLCLDFAIVVPPIRFGSPTRAEPDLSRALTPRCHGSIGLADSWTPEVLLVIDRFLVSVQAVLTNSGETRVWLITGASSGFGRAIAEAALARGDS